MIQYFIYSTLCSGVLLLAYKLFLEHETMHRFKRFYLLSAILFSYIVPLIAVRITIATIPQQYIQAENLVPIPVTLVDTINWQYAALGIFFLVSTLLFTRLAFNLYRVISKVNAGKRRKYQHATLILNTEEQMPHSFLNYIFIGRDIFENTESEKEILYHELVHVRQKHSYDILFVEFIRCLFWVNPFLSLYKKTIQLNHEFLADEGVNNRFNNIYAYQNLLLEKVHVHQEINFACQFNFQVTKKRLIMMKKVTPGRIKAVKLFAILPILAGSLFVFGRNELVQQETANHANDTVLQDSPVKPQQTNTKRNATYKTSDNKDKRVPLKTRLSPLRKNLDRLDGNLGQQAPLKDSLRSLQTALF